MSDESMMIVNNGIEELRLKKKQLSVLQTKETEAYEKLARLNKLLEQAGIDHETCIRSNLAGNASDKDLKESKINLKKLADSIQECKESLESISKTKANINSEISSLNGDISVHRSIICTKVAGAAHEEMAKNKKLNEKLISEYAAFIYSGDFDRSWTQHLARNFPHPSERDIQLAVDKFKSSNDFMRDCIYIGH